MRFRVDQAPLPGSRRRADVVFRRERVAIYFDSCFWHACSAHGTVPRTNRDWWSAKLERNRERDRSTDAQLALAGWLSIRVWQHDEIPPVVESIVEQVRARRVDRAAPAAHDLRP